MAEPVILRDVLDELFAGQEESRGGNPGSVSNPNETKELNIA